MKKLLFTILFLLIATPVSAKMLWEYGSFSERAEMAVDNGIVANVSEYKGTYEQNIGLLEAIENYNNGNFGASTQPAALSTYNLAGSGVSSSATSITLQSLTLPQNDYLIQDSNLSDIFYVTLEPGSKVRQEIASCTTVTQNAGGTATLSGCTRGLSPITPYTASSTLQFSHAGGSQVIFSDPPQLFNLYPAKANNEAITGVWTYNTNLPTSTLTATSSNQFVIKSLLDSTAQAGGATSTESVTGIVQLGTQLEMASSSSDSNNPQVIQTKYATSSPDVRGLYVPVSENDGYLNQGWIDLSESFTFTATTTLATTTADKLIINNEASIASSTLTGNIIIDYQTASNSPASVGYVTDNAAVPSNFSLTVSDNLRASADTERETIETSYTKLKEFEVGIAGTYRVKFDLRRSGGAAATIAYGKIYKNGVAFGTERTDNDNAYNTFSEDLAFSAGDLIQLYAYSDDGDRTAQVQNFRLYFDIAYVDVVITD